MTLDQARDDYLANPTYMNGRLYRDVAVDEWMRERITDAQLLRVLSTLQRRYYP